MPCARFAELLDSDWLVSYPAILNDRVLTTAVESRLGMLACGAANFRFEVSVCLYAGLKLLGPIEPNDRPRIKS
jgi:hypothetical protein